MVGTSSSAVAVTTITAVLDPGAVGKAAGWQVVGTVSTFCAAVAGSEVVRVEMGSFGLDG